MTVEAIVRLIEQEAAAEEERLLADAGARSRATVEAAERAATAAVAQATARAAPGLLAEEVRAINAGRLRLLERRAQIGAERVTAVFTLAGDRLNRIAAGEDPERWRRSLRRLTEEALHLAGSGPVVRVRPGDGPHIADLVEAVGGSLETAAEGVEPGVHVIAEGGAIEVDATLALRLGRARARLCEAVAAELGLTDFHGPAEVGRGKRGRRLERRRLASAGASERER